MPTGAFHSNYWAGSADVPEPPGTGASANGGYVPWQIVVVAGSGFGALQVVWDKVAALTRTTSAQVRNK